MATHDPKQELQNLSDRMRSEWDRRVRHDYRYWMSDGVQSDESMWEAGERDFSLLTEGLSAPQLAQWKGLEIGCGVGRLLGPAAKRLKHVIGVDVSGEALTEARRLLSSVSNVQLLHGNGCDLRGLPSASIDFGYSFAALGSMPVSVFSAYVSELARVMKQHGVVRIQAYVGRAQQTVKEDTIALRSFDEQRFRRAFELSGFSVSSIRELTLPFSVSNHEEGLVASVVSLTRDRPRMIGAQQIEAILLPEGEASAGASWQGSDTEFQMALYRAQEQVNAKQYVEAKETIEFAKSSFGEPTQRLQELLLRLEAEIRENQTLVQKVSNAVRNNSSDVPDVSLASMHSRLGTAYNPEYYEANLRALERRFPQLASRIRHTRVSDVVRVEQSPVGEIRIVVHGVSLDNQEKPRRGGEVWAERTYAALERQQPEKIILVGFGCGYHVEAFCQLSAVPLHVIEPSPEVLKVAFATRNLCALIERIDSLNVPFPESQEELQSGFAKDRGALVIYPQSEIVSRTAVRELRRMFYAKRGLRELRPSIAVVGPIYGGSLPMAHSTARALTGMRQRVKSYDMSVFNESYRSVGRIIHDNARKMNAENKYADLLGQLVLESLDESPVDILISLAQAPLMPSVLEEIRRRGVITALWYVEDCRRFTSWQYLSRCYDYVFTIQRNEVLSWIEQAGAGRAIYVPPACDPTVHQPLTLTAEEKAHWGSELSFVGAGYNNRVQMFATLANRDFKIWGTEWPAVQPFLHLVQEQGRRLSPEEYVKIFNASTLNLNLHSSSERDGVEPFGDFINPRTFELAACGAFQLVDNRVTLPEVFVPGQEVATFNDRQSMIEQIEYYRARPEERAIIAQAGRARALSEHTYEHRLETMLGYIYADHYDKLKSKADASPWSSALRRAQKYPELKERFERIYRRGEELNLERLITDIHVGEGKLTDTEQILLFFENFMAQAKVANEG